MTDAGPEVLDFTDTATWDLWLTTHHETRSAAWLRIAKKRSGIATIAIGDALDVALCHGWIDGQRKSLDGDSFLQRYSRRRPGSSWSKVNVAKAEALITAGRMRPTGLVEITAAQADGRWQGAYEPQRSAEVPPDLAAALAAHPDAGDAFRRLGRSEQYLLMLPLLKARTAQTREQALRSLVTRLATS